jgi:hypothetical protein
MDFLEDAHRFRIGQPHLQQLDWGRNLFFTSLAPGMPIQAMEQTIAAGGSLYGRGLVPPAINFDAECVVLTPKGSPAPEIALRNRYDFGFVQGLSSGDVHLEYWGQIAGNGRTIIHISMPNTFEIDTDTPAQPFTVVPGARFDVRSVPVPGSQSSGVKVTAGFSDHPMYSFPRIMGYKLPGDVLVPHYIRWVRFTREFRTIFCARDKVAGNFIPISATGWTIDYNHTVSHTNNGLGDPVVVASTSPSFPLRGSPSQVNATDRKIMGMAQAGAPLLTPQVLASRFNPGNSRSVIQEAPNPDFVSSFWT